MRILLIDADSTIPNIALMKLSTWHKKNGDYVELIKANLPYFPNRKKKFFIVKGDWDKIYCSVVFENNKSFIIGDDITFGGTGFDLTTVLPVEVEKSEPDYSIYPENDTSYGFITRGCTRKCSFCKVPKKEGDIHKVASIENIVRHKKVKFLDNNILAYPQHKEILEELVLKKIRCQFNQGLDIRLVDNENSILLSKLNYLGEYIFAFDNWRDKAVIEQKMGLLAWRKPFQLKFFVYIYPNMPLSETVKRVIWLKENQCLPYIMRDAKCRQSDYSDFFVDLAAYCNQVNLFKKMKFSEFLRKRHKNIERIINSKRLWDKVQPAIVMFKDKDILHEGGDKISIIKLKSNTEVIYMSDFLPALQKLKENYYVFGVSRPANHPCPLCKYGNAISTAVERDDIVFSINKCGICPWMVLDNKHCLRWPPYTGQDIELRLKRINRWIKIIKKEDIRLNTKNLKRK